MQKLDMSTLVAVFSLKNRTWGDMLTGSQKGSYRSCRPRDVSCDDVQALDSVNFFSVMQHLRHWRPHRHLASKS